jgi:hypothetical protein
MLPFIKIVNRYLLSRAAKASCVANRLGALVKRFLNAPDASVKGEIESSDNTSLALSKVDVAW